MIYYRRSCFVVSLSAWVLAFTFCLIGISSASESTSKVDDPTIAACIEKVEPLVQEITGLTFKEKMKYELVTRDDFKKALEKEMLPLMKTMMKSSNEDMIARQVEAAAMSWSQTVLGSYSSLKKSLLMIPDNLQSQVERYEIKNEEVQDFIFLFVAYQMVSVLDDQCFDLQNKAKSNTNAESAQAAHALAEGHAVYIVNKIADKLKLSQLAKDAMIKSVARITDETNPIQKQQFNLFYVKGPEFVDAIVNKKGMAGVNAAFLSPPMSMQQIMNPDQYMNQSQTKVFDCAKFVEKISQKLPTNGMQSQVSQMSSITLSGTLASMGIPEKDATAIGTSCLGGATFAAGKQTSKQIGVTATVFNFNSSEAALNFLATSRMIEKSSRDQLTAMPNIKLNIVKDAELKLEGFKTAQYQQVETKVDQQVISAFSSRGVVENFYIEIAYVNPETEPTEKSFSELLNDINKERLNM